jgi:hypothetical protein
MADENTGNGKPEENRRLSSWEPPAGDGKFSTLDKLFRSQRTRNVLIAVFDIMIILVAFLLGHNSAYWTNNQIEKYCGEYKNKSIYSYGNLTNFSLPNVYQCK